MATPTLTLQESHNEVTQQLAALVSQIVYGGHDPTRMQLLMCLAALEKALPYYTPRDGLVKPAINDLRERVTRELLNANRFKPTPRA